MSIAEVIGWKFNHQEGMSTVNGVLTEFPGTMPTEAELATYTAEYEVYKVMADIREKRDTALASTDWAALPDSPTMSDAMTTYRTELRDYPATYTADSSAAFPTLGD